MVSSSSGRAAEPSLHDARAVTAPLVSVIVPCYRQARYLPDAIASIRAQTHHPVEIIVVDDGSPSGDAADDAAAVAAAHPGVQFVRQRHRGPSAARNAGLARARGEFVAFLDADDVLYPEALARGLAALDAHPECGFAAGGHMVRAGERITRTYVPTTTEPAYARMLRSNFIGMQGAVLFRRAALEQVGGYRDEVVACEDMDLFLRLLRQAPVALHDGVIAEYRWHAANSSHRSARMFEGLVRALRAQWPHVRRQPALRSAYEEGLAWGRTEFGEPVLTRASAALAERREVFAALRDLALVLRLDPAFFVRRMGRALTRRAGRRRAVRPAAGPGRP